MPPSAAPLARLALASLLAAAGAVAAERGLPIEITADRSDGNLREPGVTVLSGNVRIQQGELLVVADRAEIHRDGARVGRVVLEGSPVRLEQPLADRPGRLVAEARRIDYDPETRRMVLRDEVRIAEPRGELSGSLVEYDIATGRVRADGSGETPVRIRIEPDANRG
ncbi:MAG: lipopolysaccharide transport periplasmic protein LptA [Xanthomonadales bacterium]|nr:lipopolysaccharide transport periplasmic protein LptA [Xanthomonadales bacterium]